MRCFFIINSCMFNPSILRRLVRTCRRVNVLLINNYTEKQQKNKTKERLDSRVLTKKVLAEKKFTNTAKGWRGSNNTQRESTT